MYMSTKANMSRSAETTTSLGKHLAAIRSDRELSLRQVEELSNRIISNGYLSQIETGRVRHPSPNILHALSEVYKTNYEQLMRMSGYLGVPQSESRTRKIATLSSLNLSEAEEMELVEYLKFRRTQIKG